MLFKSSWTRLACAACVLVVFGWAASAAAQTTVRYSLSGNGGYWIGGGLPVPITKGVAPNAAMVAIPGAVVKQTQTASPAQMTICPGQLEGGAALNGGTVPTWAPQALNNPNLFQVSTVLTFKFPAVEGRGIHSPNADGNVIFKAGGRTGPATLTWCPGFAPTNPPTCNPAATYKGVSGSMTYHKTANQFGGPGQAQVGPWSQGQQQGRATIWGVAASPAPCKHTALAGTNAACFAAKGYATPAPLVTMGAPFGYYNSTAPQSAAPNLWVAWAATGGTLLFKAPAAQITFKNTPLGFGGPWTTGQLTMVAPNASPPETFTLTGSDGRAATGMGNISLVSGGLSNRTVSGPNVNRGWLNLVIGAQLPGEVPSISGLGIASLGLALLGIGAAGLALARRRK